MICPACGHHEHFWRELARHFMEKHMECLGLLGSGGVFFCLCGYGLVSVTNFSYHLRGVCPDHQTLTGALRYHYLYHALGVKT